MIIVPLYRKDQYRELLMLSDDGETLPTSWELFAAQLTEQTARAEKEGSEVYVVKVNLFDLISHCAQTGVRMSAKERTNFAVLQAMREDPYLRNYMFEALPDQDPDLLRQYFEEAVVELASEKQPAQTPAELKLPRLIPNPRLR
jgi:hypothetical protein